MKFNYIVGSSKIGWVINAEYEQGVDPKLKKCPFCRSSAHLEVVNTHTPSYWVQCECGAEKHEDNNLPRVHERWKRSGLSKEAAIQLHREAFQEAIDSWNNRNHG